MTDCILFVCLTTRGIGETRHAVCLAEQLRSGGARTHFLAHESASSVLQDAAQPATFVHDHMVPLFRFFLDAIIKRLQPDALVLGDWFTTSLALERSGQRYEDVFQAYGMPVYAIDTWVSNECGLQVDLYGHTHKCFPDWRDFFAGRLLPVPMANPAISSNVFSTAPKSLRLPKKLVRHIRRDLNVEIGKAVLICTAGWQHAIYEDPAPQRLQASLPRVIGEYLRSLGPDVKLIHVGPERLDFGLCDKEIWLPPMRPERFDALVASVDLLLTTNISASTNVRAMADGVPVLCIYNSKHVATIEELPAAWRRAAPPEMEELIKQMLPVFPFHLWPLGYYDFLQPVLRGNPYLDALCREELLDINGMCGTLNDLLFCERRLADQLQRSSAFIDIVENLPCPTMLSPSERGETNRCKHTREAV